MHIQKSWIFGAFLCVLAMRAAGAEQPNILWIITDDQRMDSNGTYNVVTTGKHASALGYVSSPNLDSLAAEGVMFVNAYCNSPACAPSRASIITGKYPHHNGIYNFERTHNQVDFFTPTLPQALGKQGYQTAMFGKSGYYIFEWGPGQTWRDTGFYDFKIDFKKDLKEAGFTDWHHRQIWRKGKKEGTRSEFYYPDGSHRYFYTERPGGLSEEDINNKAIVDEELDILYSYTRQNTGLIIGGVSPMPADKTIDARILEEYMNYLRHADASYQTLAGKTVPGAKALEPQFISLSFHFPHTPVLPPKSFRDRFKDKIYNIPKFDEQEVDKLPPQLQLLYEKLKIDGLTYQEKQQAIRDYYAFCAYGDSLIGQAVREFKNFSKHHHRPYLIVYVCGDHGWQLGEQGIEAKFAPWQLSNHGAAIVVSSDPTCFQAGQIYSGFVEYVDIMPTLLAAAGADISTSEYDFLDGRNWAEVIKKGQKSMDYTLGEINLVAGPRAFLRTKNFAFSMKTRRKNGIPGKSYLPNEDIRWSLDAPLTDIDPALYDLRVDPNERNNVANAEEYRATVAWFRNKLGHIVLGDGRVEVDWSQKNSYSRTNFATGADNKKIELPDSIAPQVATVQIEEERINMMSREVYQLHHQVANSDAAITWTSNNPEVAHVTKQGKVVCGTAGTAGIIARLPGGATDICVVYVSEE